MQQFQILNPTRPQCPNALFSPRTSTTGRRIRNLSQILPIRTVAAVKPPSLGDVRQMVVSEPSGSNQMHSIGQLPSVNDVCRREPSQSEASCNRYDGPDENEVQQQVMSELNDPRGAVNRSKDSTGYSCYGERTEDLLSRFSSQFSGIPPQPPPLKQVQRIGTSVIKVFKSGEIERFVNISAYSGYDKLKQDIARNFGIEGHHGWRLLYADHNEDMLLVGDDPWLEFVDCVRYIKILSPQEVQTSWKEF